ncbi:MAG TPA: DUF2142 domain-containing protein [Candidatus Saccharimonadia bacterium]|nr:DUF2142 domain-containing protein [Candidatus Saccharimonadia bacterium]
MKKKITERLNAHNIFIVIALVFGFIFVFATPLLWGADETTQLGRAYQISQNHVQPEFFGIFHGGGYGGQLPTSLINLIGYVNQDLTHPHVNANGVGQVNKPSSYKQLGSQKIGKANTLYVFSNTAPYSPIAYIPSSLGLKVGISLNLDVANTLHLARLMGLIFYIAIVGFAIRALRNSRTKWIIFTVALLPMSLFQASMITADSLTIAVSLLLVSMVLKALVSSDRLTRSEIIAICTSVIAVPLLKPTYLPLIFLLLLVPNKTISTNPNKPRILKAGILMLGLTLFGIWSYDTRNITDTLRLVIPGNVWNTINPTLQEHFLSTHIFSYLAAVFRTFIINDNTYFNQFFGLLGFNYVQIPAISIFASFISLVLAVLLSESFKERISKLKIASIFVIVIASVAIMLTTFYITLTSVGGDTIGGLQGRYFIPLAAPALIGIAFLLPKLRLVYSKIAYRQATSLIVILVILSLSASALKYYYFTFG